MQQPVPTTKHKYAGSYNHPQNSGNKLTRTQHAARHVFGIFELTRTNEHPFPPQPFSIIIVPASSRLDSSKEYISEQSFVIPIACVKNFMEHCKGDESDFPGMCEEL